MRLDGPKSAMLAVLAAISISTAIVACGGSGGSSSGGSGASTGMTTGVGSSGTVGSPDEPPIVLSSNDKDCGLGGTEMGAKLELGSCVPFEIPGYPFQHCVKAHPDCTNAGTQCPVYVTAGIGDAYFDRVEYPEKYGKFLVIRLDSETWRPQGDEERLHMAAFIEKVRSSFVGIDQDKMYMVTFSNPSDTLSAISGGDHDGPAILDGAFAAFVKMGYCMDDPGTRGYPSHWLGIAGGDDDVHAGDGKCQPLDPGKPDAPALRAAQNGCSLPAGEWSAVDASEPYLGGADGSGVVMRRSFGVCEKADVVHYRFLDEGHTTEYGAHFEPPLRGEQIAWNFLQGRSRPGTGGVLGLSSACLETTGGGFGGAKQ